LKTLKKIDPMSAARLAAVAGFIWGLAVGVLVFIGTDVAQYMGRMYMGYQAMLPVTGVAMIVALPIAYCITGFIGAYICALLYNFVAGKFGGIKIDLK
jgi:hypothetical protein